MLFTLPWCVFFQLLMSHYPKWLSLNHTFYLALTREAIILCVWNTNTPCIQHLLLISLCCKLPETALSFRHCPHPHERVEAATPTWNRAERDVLFSLSLCCSSRPLCMGLTLNSHLQFSRLVHKPCKYCSMLLRENGNTLGGNMQRFSGRMLKGKCTCL